MDRTEPKLRHKLKDENTNGNLLPLRMDSEFLPNFGKKIDLALTRLPNGVSNGQCK